jgi:hypothetical protein
MGFDYRKLYRNLINDLTALLITSIEKVPEDEQETPTEESKNFYYKDRPKRDDEPLIFD